MHNLDIFPETALKFKYDLKFSEYNRKHLDTSEIHNLKLLLLTLDEDYQGLINTNEDE